MIRTDITLPISYTSDDIIDRLVSHLPIGRDEIKELSIVRRTLNLSDKSDIHYKATVAVSLDGEREQGLLRMRKKVRPHEDLSFSVPECKLSTRPVVVGAGPAGLFAALVLAEAGARPILYERGMAIEDRDERVKLFTTLGILDPECNIQFGEGGAGAYSDGKLKSGAPDKYKLKVLCEFVNHGAPEDIIYSTGAHVGTDKLSRVVRGIREKIISLGGEVHFSSKLVDIKVNDGRVVGGRVEISGESCDFETDTLILATGHSARDVFSLLKRLGAPLEPRGFGIGVRVEHPRENINRMIYGDNPPSGLGAASYHLVTHLNSGRSVYSFCMCPGGTVVAAAGERGGIVTNGMSEYARDAENSNSAILVSVTPEDFPSDDPLAGVELQRAIERRAFALTSGTYKAPSQRMLDFCFDRVSSAVPSVTPSYPLGTVNMRADEYLPEYVTSSLRAAIDDFEAWLPGFYHPDAPLTGPETRTTSPVRTLRTDTFETVGIKGLYPIGEGAGYAGGIVSSARDGVMCAESIILSNTRK